MGELVGPERHAVRRGRPSDAAGKNPPRLTHLWVRRDSDGAVLRDTKRPTFQQSLFRLADAERALAAASDYEGRYKAWGEVFAAEFETYEARLELDLGLPLVFTRHTREWFVVDSRVGDVAVLRPPGAWKRWDGPPVELVFRLRGDRWYDGAGRPAFRADDLPAKLLSAS